METHQLLHQLSPNSTPNKVTLSMHQPSSRWRHSKTTVGTMEERFVKVEMIKKKDNFSRRKPANLRTTHKVSVLIRF